MILSRGGTNGKLVWNSPASEKGTGKSGEGSPAVWGCARGSGKLTFKRPEHSIGCGSKEDQPRTESAMGKESGE